MCNMNFLPQSIRKLLSDIHTYIHTDRQTDTIEIIYHSSSRLVNKSHCVFSKLNFGFIQECSNERLTFITALRCLFYQRVISGN